MLLILSNMTRLSQNYLSLTEEFVHCRPCCWSLNIRYKITDGTLEAAVSLSSEDTRGYLLAAAVTRATPPRQSPAPRPEVRAARSQQQLDHVLKQREGENYEALSLGALVKCSLNSL